MPKKRILIAEDEFVVANDIKQSLESMGYRVDGIVTSGEKAIMKAESKKPNLVLMDIILRGEMDGIDAAKQIRASIDVPVIFLTAYVNEKLIERAKEAEAFGYLIKPFEANQLKASIEIALKKYGTERQITGRANYDALTGLPNEYLFHDRLSHALSRAHRYQHSVGLLYIDLDDFGAVNKKFNQEGGDEILRQAANRLKGCIRETDTAARKGGDEFVIILQDIAGKKDAELVAKKVIRSVNRPIRVADSECIIGVSIGISMYPSDAPDASILRKQADFAMHRVKKNFKNNYLFYDAAVSGKSGARKRDE